MDPRIKSKPPRPLLWKSPGNGMSWHHVIPYHLLRDVWNRLVDQQIATGSREAKVAIRRYLLLCDRSLLNCDDLIDRMRCENTTQRRTGHNYVQPLEDREVRRLQIAAAWPAWNAVTGPNSESRSDPAEHVMDRFTAGLTAQEATQMRQAELLFYTLQSFVDAGPAPGPDRLNALAGTAAAVRPFLAYDEPIKYRAGMWVQDHSTGKWRKRRDGEADSPVSEQLSLKANS